MIFLVFSIILFLSPLLFGSDVFWAIFPIQTLLFITIIFQYKKISRNISNFPYPELLIIPWMILSLLLLVSTCFSANLNTSIDFTTYFFAVSSCFVLASRGKFSSKTIFHLCLIMIFTANLEVFITVFQTFDLLPHKHWFPASCPAGTFFNHNHFASLLEITLPVAMSFVLFEQPLCTQFQKNRLFINIFLYVSIFVQLTGLILSQSRGAWLSFIIAMFYFSLIVVKKKKFKKFIIPFLALIVTSVLLFSFNPGVNQRLSTLSSLKKDMSAQSRIRFWKESLKMIADHPFLGTGPGTFPVAFPMYRPQNMHYYVNQVHNDYLGWMAETGILSFPCILLVFFLFLLRPFQSKYSGNPYIISAGTAVLSIGIHSIADYNLRLPAIGFYLAFLTGISFILKKSS